MSAELIDRLTANVQAVTTNETDACKHSLDTATALIDRTIQSWAATVPDDVRDTAILETASDLYFRRHARNGVMEISGTDIQPFRINRDPLAAARPILRPWMPMGMGVA